MQVLNKLVTGELALSMSSVVSLDCDLMPPLKSGTQIQRSLRLVSWHMPLHQMSKGPSLIIIWMLQYAMPSARKLYRDTENLELYVGLVAEEAKPVGGGAGLCPSFTMARYVYNILDSCRTPTQQS